MEIKYNELKFEVETFLNKIESDESLQVVLKKYFRGIQVLFTPLNYKPKFMFIGINPGAGYYNNEREKGKNVKRLSPMKNTEYVGQKYRLATETRKLFELAEIPQTYLKNSVKSNFYFLATKNSNELSKLLIGLEKYNIESVSEMWINKLVEIVEPEFIICEGKSAFEKFTKSTVLKNDEVYFKKIGNLKVIGYKRYLSNILNKEKVVNLLKEKL